MKLNSMGIISLNYSTGGKMKLLWGTTVFGKGSDGPGGIQIHYGGKFYSRPGSDRRDRSMAV